jgi:nucleotide-binding universal stress UspA family protein
MRPLPIRSILVASDLLESSDVAIDSAAALAARTGADIHLIHAVEFTAVPYSEVSVSAEYRRQAELARESLQEQILRVLPEGSRPASQTVCVERAPKAILDRGRDVGADLIVIGPARPRVFRGAILGNTADHIIRSSDVPVLVLRHRTGLDLRRVVVPIDLADPARGALDQALTWAGALGPRASGTGSYPAEVRVLYVIPPTYEDSAVPFDRVVAAPQLQLEIEDAQQRVGSGSDVEVREETVWGSVPADEIVRYIRSRPTDLLVLGTHGYGALGRALIGSVTSRIVRTATCPMLLVPPSMWAVGREPTS